MALRRSWGPLAAVLSILALYLLSLYSYPLFHSLAEFFRVAVAFSIFIFAWNSRRFFEDDFFLFLGIAFLFVGSLNLIHTLAYDGMGVFLGYDENLPTQAWIASRYVEALSLFMAPFLIGRRLKANFTLLVYSLICLGLVASIFTGLFPDCFIAKSGLTPFKNGSEVVISIILLGAIFMLYRNRSAMQGRVFRLLVGSVALSMVSDLSLAFDPTLSTVFDFSGHVARILSFFLIYLGVIKTGLSQPLELLFRDLTKSQEVERSSRVLAEARAAELEALRANLSDLLAELELSKLLDTILARAIALLDASGGELALFDKVEEQLHVVVSRNMGRDYVGTRMRLGEGAMGLVAQNLTPLIVHDFSEWKGRSPQYSDNHWDAALAVPLRVGERLVGVIGIVTSDPSRKLGVTDETLLTLFAQQAAIAIKNSQLFEEAKHQAQTDALTGLANRRHFFELGENEINRTRRYGHPLSLIMFDIDGFKLVNDRHGHSIGDQLLVKAARTLKGQVRDVDVVARYGGDEFVVLLPETPLGVGLQVAERLRVSVAMADVRNSKAEPLNITISLGVAAFGEQCTDLDSMLVCADKALYLAKDGGQNQAIAWA